MNMQYVINDEVLENALYKLLVFVLLWINYYYKLSGVFTLIKATHIFLATF